MIACQIAVSYDDIAKMLDLPVGAEIALVEADADDKFHRQLHVYIKGMGVEHPNGAAIWNFDIKRWW